MTDEKSLQGLEAALNTDEQRREAIEQAFDYRGDVTLVTAEGREIEGYIFDRRLDDDEPFIRMMATDGDRIKVPYRQITGLKFTGRDAAHGKSFETWMKKFIEKKTGKK